jgi:ribonucleoside-diphosphate reductase alpha chain
MIQNYLPTDYQNFIALSRYARWKDDEQRRENWGETVDRYFDYMTEHLKKNYSYDITKALKSPEGKTYSANNGLRCHA